MHRCTMLLQPKNSVVVPVDFSGESLAAVDVALPMVKSASRLHVIHVIPPPPVSEAGVGWGARDDARAREQAEQRLLQWLSNPKYQGVDLVVATGEPGQQIADFAQSILAELIVLPSHGRKGLARLLIGSVAERVVQLAHCPVLVLKHA